MSPTPQAADPANPPLVFKASAGAEHVLAQGCAPRCSSVFPSVDAWLEGPHAWGVRPIVVAQCQGPWRSMAGSRAFGVFAILTAIVAIVIVLRAAMSGGPILLGGAVLFFGLLVTFVVRTFGGHGVVVAGDDGVGIEWRHIRRFVSYDDLDRVIVDGPQIGLVRKAGAIVRVHLAGIAPGEDALESELVRRIEECLDEDDRDPSPDEDALARRGRAADAWLASIAERVAPKESYRAPAFDRDALHRLASDPRAEPSARAAAAYALRMLELTASERADLRSAAEATAHPELHDAFAVLSDPAAPSAAIARTVGAVR